MSEKAEKQKQSQTKHIPKDAQVIMSIMKEMDLTEYEPRVINQLLEFSYRYVACVLEDAKTYANHAKKKNIDLEDVKLALQIQLEQSFCSTPPRNVLSEMARAKNNIPLPLVKPHCGIRLPQDRFCLSNSNVKVKLPQFSKKGVRVTNLIDINMKKSSKVNIGVVKRTNNMPIMSRTQAVTIPKPVPKFTNIPPKTVAKPKIHITQSIPGTESSNSAIVHDDNPLKRKRELDSEFDM